MSNSNINVDSHIITLDNLDMENNDNEELLVKSIKGKERIPNQYENNLPPLSQNRNNSGAPLKIKLEEKNEPSISITNKGKGSQRQLYAEPTSSSLISDIEGGDDNISETTSAVTNATDTNNNIKKLHQSPSQQSYRSQSLRNKRFSYNSPGVSNHQWNTASSSSSINATSANNINTNTTVNSNNSNNNSNSVPLRQQLGLTGSFAELLNLTSNAAQALASNSNNNNNTNNNSNNNNNNNNGANNIASTSSNRLSYDSRTDSVRNSHTIFNSNIINIEAVDAESSETGENQSPSQIGPGKGAWLFFRVYVFFRALWALAFVITYSIVLAIKRSNTCDSKIYKYSISFYILFIFQAIVSVILLYYLPYSITRYTSVIRKKVVISNYAWDISIFLYLAEIAMVIVGTFLLFNKNPLCDLGIDTSYVNITKVIIICVICFYTIIFSPLFILPCTCAFKLLPEYKGISEKVLKRFNSIVYSPNGEVDEDDAPSCSICMENYQPGTRIKRLPCKHEFHPECITQWLETNNSCPICRQTFK